MTDEITLLKAAHVIAFDGTNHRYLSAGEIVIRNNAIDFVGKHYSGQVQRVIDVGDSLITPGFVNTHMHMAGSPLDKSFVEDRGNRNFFNSGLFEMLPARAGAQDEQASQACIDFSLLELLHGGTTTAVELGPMPDYAAEQAARVGLRAYIGLMVRSARWFTADGKSVEYEWDEDAGMRALERAVQWVATHDGSHDGLVRGILSPSQVDTCSVELLTQAVHETRRLGVPITMHVSQSVNEFHEMVRRHGCSPIEWLDRCGLLVPELILGHAIIVAGSSWAQYAGNDIERLARSGCSVAHSPWVFARRGIALESFSRYRAAGINMSLGTDSAPQSMLESMRLAATIGKITDRQAESPCAAEVFSAATLGGANALGRSDLGRLSAGAKADLVVWRTNTLSMTPLRDPIRNIVFSAQASDVDRVMINGRWVLVDGVVCEGPSIETAARNLQAAGERMWPKMASVDWAGRGVDELSPQSFEPWDGLGD